MNKFNVHFVHVGNMSNKGTQALFHSDVHVVQDIPETEISATVSTTDIEGVRKLNLPLDAILPPMVDLPYDKADQLINKFGGKRSDLRYKWLAFAFLLSMFLQIPLTLFSVLFLKLGLKPFYRGEVLRCVKNSDLVVSHSDESYKETASLLPLNPIWVVTFWSMLVSRTCEVMVAKALGKPVILFPNSVGPFRTWMGRFLVRLSLNSCDHLLIRDSISYAIIKRLDIRAPTILTYDTALLFEPQTENTLRHFPSPSLGVCPGIYGHSLSKDETENYILAHAKALDGAIEKYGFSVVFLPHYVSGFPYDDLHVSKLIIDRMKHKQRVEIVNTKGVDEFKQCLNQMDTIISSKMHPAVLGASNFVPIICIVYDHKQSSFFERLGMIDCTLGIRSVSCESLSSKIDYVWQHNVDLKASLARQIPGWQKNVRDSIKRVVYSYVTGK